MSKIVENLYNDIMKAVDKVMEKVQDMTDETDNGEHPDTDSYNDVKQRTVLLTLFAGTNKTELEIDSVTSSLAEFTVIFEKYSADLVDQIKKINGDEYKFVYFSGTVFNMARYDAAEIAWRDE